MLETYLKERLHGGIIVSCQADPKQPWGRPEVLAALAAAAEAGGAAAIRANGPENIEAVAKAVKIPLIGLYKVIHPKFDVYITPDFASAQTIFHASSPPPAIIAIDATLRPRPGPDNMQSLIARIQNELGAAVMADVSSLEEGLAAADAGADLVGTTLSGYTQHTAHLPENQPNLKLVQELASRLTCPVLCEGRVQTPVQARQALDAGAWAVVVGTAITAIDWVTKNFTAALHT